MQYRHLFFDLDHTLWDFERNSAESLDEIYKDWSLHRLGIASSNHFIESFLKINTELWQAFDMGRLEHAEIRKKRFQLVFESLGVTCPDNHQEMGECYLHTLPTKRYLLDGALEVLEHVRKMGYHTHVITNGFNDIQARKIRSAGIHPYFGHVITFENAEAKKPDPKIFNYALALTQAKVETSLMIGDNWVADIQGAQQVGMDTVYYNPAGLEFDQKPTYDIQHLRELLDIL
ncbi:putative hydrolase of the HAD superfamily [Dyadobacter jejuensis]|uniref:Putative hydrolase of the HAD superfamily n=1 Tax=Dyadobacter jejuensis TaxID=1082580 RepID=A0A316AGM2_9BACT|nr:YjjG family noncanonical pyrimidine nucleotidase [Dyadobacter jejuensis]PWJ56945.1 putative hydrolase of the HAD superfamily [Dyadobacter jejuensis]